MLRSPVQAATEPRLDDGDGDMETLFLPDLDEEGAASANEETDATDVNAATASEEEAPSSHVAVCLLDPEALQGGRLEELSEQDRAARREVDQLFHPDSMWPWEDLAPELRAPAPATLPPAASKGGPAPLSVLQEEGSTAVLYVDPAGVQVVDNHFTRRAEPKDLDHPRVTRDEALIFPEIRPPLPLASAVRRPLVVASARDAVLGRFRLAPSPGALTDRPPVPREPPAVRVGFEGLWPPGGAAGSLRRGSLRQGSMSARARFARPRPPPGSGMRGALGSVPTPHAAARLAPRRPWEPAPPYLVQHQCVPAPSAALAPPWAQRQPGKGGASGGCGPEGVGASQEQAQSVNALQGAWSNMDCPSEHYVIAGHCVTRVDAQGPQHFTLHWDQQNRRLQWGTHGRLHLAWLCEGVIAWVPSVSNARAWRWQRAAAPAAPPAPRHLERPGLTAPAVVPPPAELSWRGGRAEGRWAEPGHAAADLRSFVPPEAVGLLHGYAPWRRPSVAARPPCRVRLSQPYAAAAPGGGQGASGSAPGGRRAGRQQGEKQLPCGLRASEVADLLYREITPNDYETLLRLDDTIARPTVSAGGLGSLPLAPCDDFLGEQCSVCLAAFEAADEVNSLPCGHHFHRACIGKWLGECSRQCPLCGTSYESDSSSSRPQ
ncbi:unnamed protein product [Prorocentrum cordatum]|uniref:RING-type domain-containing protein n=1 Tax=Prorocentrum cordatum TaxID=2364126 RepID=A0ABN9W969_9DINO|nr:unnamed protein product [Polarella glacialis]